MIKPEIKLKEYYTFADIRDYIGYDNNTISEKCKNFNIKIDKMPNKKNGILTIQVLKRENFIKLMKESGEVLVSYKGKQAMVPSKKIKVLEGKNEQ